MGDLQKLSAIHDQILHERTNAFVNLLSGHEKDLLLLMLLETHGSPIEAISQKFHTIDHILLNNKEDILGIDEYVKDVQEQLDNIYMTWFKVHKFITLVK